MKNKNIFIIIMIIFSIILIGVGLVFSLNRATLNKEDKEKIEEVLKNAEKDFGKSGYTIKLNKVDGNNYIFYQNNDSTKELSMIITYNLDTDMFSIEDKETISDINVEE